MRELCVRYAISRKTGYKRVTDAGTIRFQQRLLYLASALDTSYVGLEEIDDGMWSIHFGTVLLARFDQRDRIIRE